MSLITELEKWQKDLTALSAEKIKAEGKLEQAMDDLKEVGFKTVESAREELVRLKQNLNTAEGEAEDLLKEFQEKFKEFIE